MILCIGEILVDRFVQGNSVCDFAGGAPLNVACGIARLGGDAVFCGSVGDDSVGAYLRETVRAYTLHDCVLETCRNRRTTIALVTLTDGERSFRFEREQGADYLLSVSESLVLQADAVHLGSLALSVPEGRGRILQIAQTAKRLGKPLSFDVNYRDALYENARAAVDAAAEVAEMADIIKFSEEEYDLFGRYGALPKASKSKLLCVTRGAAGSAYDIGAGLRQVPGFSVTAEDTTGAGDAFFAALLFGLFGGRCRNNETELYDLFRFANAVGACTCLRRGAIDAFPRAEEIEALIKAKN